MKIYLLLLFASICLFSGCKGQTKADAKNVYNKDFKWTISIPEAFDTVNAEQWTKMQNRGETAIEKTYEAEVEIISITNVKWQKIKRMKV